MAAMPDAAIGGGGSAGPFFSPGKQARFTGFPGEKKIEPFWKSPRSRFSVQLRDYGTRTMVVRANAVLRPVISSTVTWQL